MFERVVRVGPILVAACWPLCALAHHSSAMYDDHKSVTIEGTVTRYLWANPHVYIYVAQQVGPQRIEWEIEASPPSILRRLGWSAATLHSGDAIVVTGKPAKDPAHKALVPTSIKQGEVTLFDRKGEVGQLARYDGPASAPAQGLEGVWVTLLDLKTEDLLDEDKMPLTPKGRAAHRRFDERTMHPGAHCVPYPAPVFMITPDLKRIRRANGVLLIDGEFDAAQRTVHLDTATHDGAAVDNQGHSIGHWEGSSLVIDTTRFADNAVGNAYGIPSGALKHLVERLTPAADGKSLTYHFELSDPEYIAATVSADVKWVFSPTSTYAPDKCNPEDAKHFTRQ
jgi:hypothetical protein